MYPVLVPGVPYSAVGAPMIPANQRLDVEVVSPSKFVYRVLAGGGDPISAGSWTFVNHHGSGYAVSVADAMAFRLAKLYVNEAISEINWDEKSLAPLGLSSAEFYWLLRCALTDNGVFDTTTSAWERLKNLESPIQLDDSKTAYERLIVLAGMRNRLLAE